MNDIYDVFCVPIAIRHMSLYRLILCQYNIYPSITKLILWTIYTRQLKLTWYKMFWGKLGYLRYSETGSLGLSGPTATNVNRLTVLLFTPKLILLRAKLNRSLIGSDQSFKKYKLQDKKNKSMYTYHNRILYW